MTEHALQILEGLDRSPPFEDVNLYETDAVLRDCVAREGASEAGVELAVFGARAGSAGPILERALP